MKEWNIAVIGCGALGKRHLESILKSELPLKVYCVDINAQVFSGEFFGGGRKKENVITSTDVRDLPEVIDVAVLAMTAQYRREVFDKLISHVKVKNIIFEKVLFQRVADYYYVGEILKKLHI